jgi:glutamine synthetase
MLPSALIESAVSRLTAYGLSPVYGAELECYVLLPEEAPEVVNGFFLPVYDTAQKMQIPLLRIEQERGKGQFELVLGTFTNAIACADAITTLKQSVIEQANVRNVTASFAAKPAKHEPGSALHVHVNLMYQGENAFHKNDESISDALHYALGGLCAISPYVMPILCPDAAGFARYHDPDHVPTTASWGSNNRSCAVRIPYTPVWEDKRLEWRIASADADPLLVIALMLHAVACGLDERITPPTQSYGLARREVGAIPLPLTHGEAREMMQALPKQFQPLTPEMLQGWI